MGNIVIKINNIIMEKTNGFTKLFYSLNNLFFALSNSSFERSTWHKLVSNSSTIFEIFYFIIFFIFFSPVIFLSSSICPVEISIPASSEISPS